VVGPATAYPNLRAALAPLSMTQVGSGLGAYRTIACNGTTAQCSSTNGWRVDLAPAGSPPAPGDGERVNVQMQLRSGTLVVGSNVPIIDACSAGGYSWLNYLNYSSGLAVSSSPGLAVSTELANSLIVGLTIIQVSDGSKRGIITTNDAGAFNPPIPIGSTASNAKRVSWREIVIQ
jgi:type IV pilus assembly protein PilY1